ncbi:MAG: transglycosylase SLT domain-containing protein [Saprospiraceae bacterium]|nr:transglycosylase SLT domain-containing protein [Pyrinomonadaceae bacterium]
MKRCPECKRDYYDDTLLYCLDDGSRLLEGPASDEAVTAIFASTDQNEQEINASGVTAILSPGTHRGRFSRNKSFFYIFAAVVLLPVGIIAVYTYVFSVNRQTQYADIVVADDESKHYWEMQQIEQIQFISQRAQHVQKLIGDEESYLDEEALIVIKEQIDDYVEEKDSLSQKPFEEGLRAIYGRASQFAPLVARSYESQKVPVALGLYQAMIESEYHDCLNLTEHPRAPVGLFQFSRKTAEAYDLKPADYCDVQKQCVAAARHMSDLISDFGSEKSSWTLALLSFNQGPKDVRDYLRQLRGRGIMERSYWTILRHQKDLQSPMTDEANRYVPRFFAAAIIGETPAVFDLSTPPLTTLR